MTRKAIFKLEGRDVGYMEAALLRKLQRKWSYLGTRSENHQRDLCVGVSQMRLFGSICSPATGLISVACQPDWSLEHSSCSSTVDNSPNGVTRIRSQISTCKAHERDRKKYALSHFEAINSISLFRELLSVLETPAGFRAKKSAIATRRAA